MVEEVYRCRIYYKTNTHKKNVPRFNNVSRRGYQNINKKKNILHKCETSHRSR